MAPWGARRPAIFGRAGRDRRRPGEDRRGWPLSAPAPSMYSEAALGVASRLGLRMGRPNVEEFAATLTALARSDPRVIAVTSDSRGSGKLGGFARALPRQIVEVGIAEQNLVGMAA